MSALHEEHQRRKIGRVMLLGAYACVRKMRAFARLSYQSPRLFARLYIICVRVDIDMAKRTAGME